MPVPEECPPVQSRRRRRCLIDIENNDPVGGRHISKQRFVLRRKDGFGME